MLGIGVAAVFLTELLHGAQLVGFLIRLAFYGVFFGLPAVICFQFERKSRRAVVTNIATVFAMIAGLDFVVGACLTLALRWPAERKIAQLAKEYDLKQLPSLATADRSTSTANAWTDEEKRNIAHFRRTLKALEALASPNNELEPLAQQMAINRALRTALDEANAARDEVLARAHPGLPTAFRGKLVRMLELIQQLRDRGQPDYEGVAQVTALGEAWDKWWLANGKDVRIPNDAPE
jgi:hypothetical protein